MAEQFTRLRNALAARPGLALGAVLLFGWMLRGIVWFVYELPPGMNGGYYPVQVRAVLHTGRLALPDFPLLFYIQAALSVLLSLILNLDRAIITVTRLTDTFVPVLLVVPIYWLAHTFAQTDRETTSSSESTWRASMATIIAGIFAVGCGNLTLMTGDFQKNSFALPLFLFFVYFIYSYIQKHEKRTLILAIVFLIAVCTCHLGAASLTIVYTLLYLALSVRFKISPLRLVLLSGSLVVLLLVVFSLVYAFDPQRVLRLVYVFSHPARLFSQSALAVAFRGPGGGQPMSAMGYLSGNTLGILGLVTLNRHRQTMDSGMKAFLLAASLCTLFYASPLIHADLAFRFSLMAFVPGLIPLTYWLSRTPRAWKWAVPITALLVVHTVFISFHLPTAIPYRAYTELKQYKDNLPQGRSLVLARHGLEWWAAWALETHITNNPRLAIKNMTEYDSVFRLEEIHPHPIGPGGPLPGMPNPTGDPTEHPPGPPGAAPPPPPGPGGAMQPFFKHETPDPSEMKIETSDIDPILVKEGQFFRLYRISRKDGG